MGEQSESTYCKWTSWYLSYNSQLIHVHIYQAKKFLGEKSAAYMTARTALREMKALTDGINRNVVPRPPQWTDKEISQVCTHEQVYIMSRDLIGAIFSFFYFVVGFMETIYSMGEE